MDFLPRRRAKSEWKDGGGDDGVIMGVEPKIGVVFTFYPPPKSSH